MELSGARVLVTGGTRGIGAAIAGALRDEGAQVLVTARTARGPSAIAADLSHADGVDALAAHTLEGLGGLDLLINNAGVQHTSAASAWPDEVADEAEVAVNLLAPMRLTRRLLPALSRNRGAVVQVTSVLALAPKTSAPAYCATKAALRSWTRAIRPRLAAHGVRVVELMPPLVRTAMTEGRDDGAIAPREVAAALVRGLRADREAILVGKAAIAHRLFRLSPRIVEHMLSDR